MDLFMMYNFTERTNDGFRNLLNVCKNHSERDIQRYAYDRAIKNYIQECIEECGSSFEEQCVIENFKEIYDEYCSEAGVA